MKISHAAALALVGWYLLVPPLNGNLSTPLFAWVKAKKSFSSLDECNKAKSYAVEFVQQPEVGKQFRTPQERQNFWSAVARAQCIASNDPRLTPPSTVRRPHSLTAVLKGR